MQQDQQQYQLKIAELQQKVAELQTKYQTQSSIDANRNATNIAMADINNASRERVASINAQAGLTADQMVMAHEQNQTALEASHQAQMDIRKHGLEIEQQAFQQQAQAVQQQLAAEQQARQTNLENQAAMQQADQAHQQALQQQAASQPTTPPQGQ
jgi:hypothetical protein